MSSSGVDPRQVVDVTRVDASCAIGGFIAAAAVSAAQYLAGHAWGRSFRNMFFGCAVVDVMAVFLVELRRPVGPANDTWVWIACGRVPTAYFVTDCAPDPCAAVGVYQELVRHWEEVASRGGDLSTVFPFDWPPDAEGVARLAALCATIQRTAARPARERSVDPSWVDASSCPTRDEPVPLPAPREGANLRPGLLACNHRGELALLLRAVTAPSQSWLDQQRDARMRHHADGSWWELAALEGGVMQMPAALIRLLGEPTAEQVAIALANANEFGRRSIRAALEPR